MGRSRNIIHAGNGREIHLDGVPNLKVDGYFRENDFFSIWDVFGVGVCIPN
jgi:hypothetical protein